MAIKVSVAYTAASNPTSTNVGLIFQLFTQGSLGAIYSHTENTQVSIDDQNLSSIIGVGERKIGVDLWVGGTLEIDTVAIKYYSQGVLMRTENSTVQNTYGRVVGQNKVYYLANTLGITEVVFQITFRIAPNNPMIYENAITNITVPRGTNQSVYENMLTTHDFTLTEFIPSTTAYYKFTSLVSGNSYIISPDPWAVLFDPQGNELAYNDNSGAQISGVKNNFEINYGRQLTGGKTYYLYLSNYVWITDNIIGDSPKTYQFPIEVKQYFDLTIKNNNPSYGNVNYADGTYKILSSDTVSLTASPQIGHKFLYWKDSSNNIISRDSTLQFHLNSNQTFIAYFEKEIYQMNLSVRPSYDYGEIIINTGLTGVPGRYYYGEIVTLTAESSSIMYKFKNWTNNNGDIISTNPTYHLTITSDYTLQANFEDNKYTISYNANENGNNPPSSQILFAGVNGVIKHQETMFKPNITQSGPTIQFINAGGELNYLTDTPQQIIQYNFIKWNTKKDGTGKDYLPGTEYTEYKDIELFAQWQPVITSYGSITFPGGNKEGFTLKGFSTNSSAVEPDIGCYPGNTWLIPDENFSNIKFYAIWGANNYTLTIQVDNNEADINIWIRDKRENDEDYSPWKKIQANTSYGYDAIYNFQYCIENGLEYQSNANKQNILKNKQGVVLNTNALMYQDLKINEEIILTIFSQKISYQNSIYFGQSKKPKQEGYVIFPNTLNTKSLIESIWVRQHQIFGKISSNEVYPYQFNTCLNNIFYMGKNETNPFNSIQDNLNNIETVIFPKIYNYNLNNLSSIFKDCTKIKSISLPYNSYTIPSKFCKSCNSLNKINIPNSVTIINNEAFSKCSQLQSILFPKNLNSLGNSAFEYCESIKEINLQNTQVSIISSYCFLMCTSLYRISLPITLQNIDEYAFTDCYNLSQIYYMGTINQWNSISINSLGNEPLLNATIYCKDGIINPKEEN